MAVLRGSVMRGSVMRGGVMLGSPMLSLQQESTDMPILAWIGPSTAAQGIAPLATQFRQQSISPLKIAQGLHPYFECQNWYDASRPNNNGGFIMAQDGWTMSNNMDAQIAYVANSDASYVVLETGRNDIPNMTAAAYYAAAKALLLELKALPNITQVFWANLWMRTTTSGVGWGSGETNRTRLLDINTEMNTWCPANGIEVIDLYTALTDPIADVDTYVKFPPEIHLVNVKARLHLFG